MSYYRLCHQPPPHHQPLENHQPHHQNDDHELNHQLELYVFVAIEENVLLIVLIAL